MSETYVTLKIREALTAAQGSRPQAQRVLMAWALEDDQLLRGLCRPFLKAIAGSAIERVARGAAVPTPRPSATGSRAPAPGKGGRALTPQMLDAIISRMGGAQPAPAPQTMRDVLRRPAAAPDTPGQDDDPRQAESLKALAAAFRDRR